MATGDVTVTYVNATQQSDLNILIYQTPVDPSISTIAVAWLVLTDVAAGSMYQFTYPEATSAQVVYDNGHGFTPADPMPVDQGKAYAFQPLGQGYTLAPVSGSKVPPDEIHIMNHSHVSDEIEARLFKNGTPLALQQGVPPGEKAAFVMTPKIYFVIASNIEQGQTFDTAQLSEKPTLIDLTNLSSVTVTLTGDVTRGYTFTRSNAQSVLL